MREADVSVLAVGFFDGVHLGHQAILRGATAALTFRNHPLSVLAPDRAPPLVMDVDERLAAIRGCGVADVVALEVCLLGKVSRLCLPFADFLTRLCVINAARFLGQCLPFVFSNI